MKCILGLLDKESEKYYNINNEHSNHMKKRKGRLKLVNQEARPLYYFEVFRPKDRSNQIHCLLEDASILVFNKKNKKLITILIADECLIDEYMKHIYSTDEDVRNLYKCAKINRKTGVNKGNGNIDEIDLKKYHEKKQKFIQKKC